MACLVNLESTDHFWLKPPFSCIIIGKSGLGKTTLLKKIIENWSEVAENVPIYKFSLYYQANQKLYDEIFDALPVETVKEKSYKLPEDLNELLIEPPDESQCNVLVFDDMQLTLEKDAKFLNFINHLIRVFTHHKRIMPIIILQDHLKAAMGALLNAVTYLFVMPCNNNMLSNLQRYIAPKSDGLIREIAKKCFTDNNRSHLLIDNSGRVADKLIYRSFTFGDDFDEPSLLFYPVED